MAWRPTRCLLQGELDNTKPLQVTGWMRFAGMSEKVTFNLKGDFHRDIRRAKIRFTGDGTEDDADAGRYMSRFAAHQTGDVGDITAGLPPRDYVDYPYYARSTVMSGSACGPLIPRWFLHTDLT